MGGLERGILIKGQQERGLSKGASLIKSTDPMSCISLLADDVGCVRYDLRAVSKQPNIIDKVCLWPTKHYIVFLYMTV